ncbi:MAG: hypothetical protein GVY36_14355 [Verrucomicrobia bacterium]|nr:hypothetical protein [Verrucomicrobiota bacterium]
MTGLTPPLAIPTFSQLDRQSLAGSGEVSRVHDVSLHARHSYRPRWNRRALTCGAHDDAGFVRRLPDYTLAFHVSYLLTGLIMLWGACETPCGLRCFSVYASTKPFRHPSTPLRGASGYDH